MEHEIVKTKEQLILEIKESRVDYINVKDFRDTVFEYLPKLENLFFVLDMRQVNYISSSCISVMISIYEQYKNSIQYKILLNKKQKKLLGALSLMDHLNIQFDD